MAESMLYQFTGSDLEPMVGRVARGERVITADSWRVVDGKAVGLERHLDRFRRSVTSLVPDTEKKLVAFLDQAVSAIPPGGEWFPRVECVGNTHGAIFRFYRREAPPRLTEAILATATYDPRESPRVKGPDLDALMALRKSVAPAGATEAVIITPDGFIAEGAYSSLLVWPVGRQELWVVDSHIPRIRSVTEEVVCDIARISGVTVREKKMVPELLDNHVVWVVSALHGIRRATSWQDGPRLSDPADFARDWSDRLAKQARRL